MSRIRGLAPALISFAIIACGGAKPASTTPYPDLDPQKASAPARPPVAGSKLVLGEIKFYQNGVLSMALHADGTLEALDDAANPPAMRKLGTLRADGTLAMDGGATFVVKPDGTVVQSNGSQRDSARPNPDYQIDGETLVIAGQRIRLDDQGALVTDAGPVNTGYQLRIEGATDPGTRRTALVILGVLLDAKAK